MSHISEPSVQHVTIPVLQRREEGSRSVMSTAYDAVAARIADPIVDILLGDSIGSVCLGIDDTCRSAWLIVQNQTIRCKRLKYLPCLVGTKMLGTVIGAFS
ncbi:hypothetical protein GWE18_38905 [Bradyrhizobium sp. CSA112]|nr:hypothetical protein [Bradyrhizobium sp. CSA112]